MEAQVVFDCRRDIKHQSLCRDHHDEPVQSLQRVFTRPCDADTHGLSKHARFNGDKTGLQALDGVVSAHCS